MRNGNQLLTRAKQRRVPSINWMGADQNTHDATEGKGRDRMPKWPRPGSHKMNWSGTSWRLPFALQAPEFSLPTGESWKTKENTQNVDRRSRRNARGAYPDETTHPVLQPQRGAGRRHTEAGHRTAPVQPTTEVHHDRHQYADDSCAHH